MATTLTPPATDQSFDAILSFPIEKSRTEVTADGDMFVYGKCTDGIVDADDQIVDPQWSAEALESWFKSGANVRKQHDARSPVGKGIHLELNRDGDNGHYLRAEVVDRDAQRLVQKGVLQAFSVGIMKPKIFSSAKARGGVIKGGEIGEVSLVDRPANRNCAFSLVKAAGGNGEPEYIGKLEGDAEVLRKALAFDPRDMQRFPQPQKGAVPSVIPYRLFSNPVSDRLQAAMAEERVLSKAASLEEDLDAAFTKVAYGEDRVLEEILGKKHREFSASERRLHAKEGNALPDGSYPIPDKDALRRAAILARSGHGNVQGARALIARRSKEMGVSNPLSSKDKKKELMDDLTEALVKAIQDGLLTVDEAHEEMGLDKGGGGFDGGAKCSTCNGSGMIRGGKVACPDCKGKGVMETDAEKGLRKPLNTDPSDQDSDDDDDDDDDDMQDKAADGGDDSAEKSDTPARPRNIGHGASSDTGKHPPSVTDDSTDDDHASGPSGRDYAGNKSIGSAASMNNMKPMASGAKKPKKGKRVLNGMKCSECDTPALKGAAFCAGCGCKFVGKGGDPAAGVDHKSGTQSGPNPGSVKESQPPTWEGEPKGGDEPHGHGSALMSDGGSGTQAVGDEGGNSTHLSSKPVSKPSGAARKSAGPAPYALARAHDAFCMAWDAQTALDEYPSLKSVSDAVSVDDVQESASKAFGDKDFGLAETLLSIARNAEMLSGAGGDMVADARAAMHKCFEDMYPTAHPTPGSVDPGMFKRPYLSAGHAPGSAEPAKASPSVPTPPAMKPASSFRRGPITAGHEASSPGNKMDMAREFAGQHFHAPGGAIAKADAQYAMEAIHDSIAAVFPDLCPLSMEYAMPATPDAVKTLDNVPSLDLQAGDQTPAEVTAAVSAMLGTAPPAEKTSEQPREAMLVKMDKTPKTDSEIESLKATVEEVVKALTVVQERFTEQLDINKQLRDDYNQLAAQPDPAQAPNRGIIVSQNPAMGGALPAERRSLVDEAVQKERDERLKFLASFTQSGDPVMRNLAEEQINKMLKS